MTKYSFIILYTNKKIIWYEGMSTLVNLPLEIYYNLQFKSKIILLHISFYNYRLIFVLLQFVSLL